MQNFIVPVRRLQSAEEIREFIAFRLEDKQWVGMSAQDVVMRHEKHEQSRSGT